MKGYSCRSFILVVVVVTATAIDSLNNSNGNNDGATTKKQLPIEQLGQIMIPTKHIGYDIYGKDVLIPYVGAGTWLYNNTIAYESVCKSFEAGITFIDTAYGYNNQIGIGKAIQDCFYNNYNTNNENQNKYTKLNATYNKSNITKNNQFYVDPIVNEQLSNKRRRNSNVNMKNRTRDDLFIVTKIPGGLSYNETIKKHLLNLQYLQLEYVDHLMIHYPSDWYITPNVSNKITRQNQWYALEYLYTTYKTRSIGISHYCTRHIHDILEINTIPISINQVEYHIGSHDIDNVINTCAQYNITFMSFSPLCGPCTNVTSESNLINGTNIMKLASHYNNITGSQLSLRYIIQDSINNNNTNASRNNRHIFGPVIPKSNNIDHIRMNMDIFSFNITDDDMKILQETDYPQAEDGDCDVP